MWHIHQLLNKDLETNNETLLCNGAVNIPLQQQSYCWKWCLLLSPCKGVIRKTTGATQSVESQPVKRRLGGWCEMATSLEVSPLRVEFCM
jgi:hypothetical protein